MVKLSELVTVQHLAALLLLVGEALLKWATPEFSWGALATAVTMTVLGWLGLTEQRSYNRKRLGIENERLRLQKSSYFGAGKN